VLTADPAEPPTPTPDRQRVAGGAGRDVGLDQRRAELSLPGERVAVSDLEQQVELLAEQVGVVLQVESEQLERLLVGAAPGDDLRPAAGEQVDRGELLPDAHRILGAEHRHGAGQPDVLGVLGRGGQDDGRCRPDEVGAVVLAEPEYVETDFVGERGQLHGLADALARGGEFAGDEVLGDLAEHHDPDLECHVYSSHDLCW